MSNIKVFSKIRI